jgi:hypothetical protein
MDRTQGWLMGHIAELPLSPAVMNAGVAGMVALVAVAAWYAVFHSSASVARLFPQ